MSEERNRVQSYEVGESWNDCVKEKKNLGLRARVCVCGCVTRQYRNYLQVLIVGPRIFVLLL
jgi:hypothetical protein